MHVLQRINRRYARVQVALPIGSNALQSRIILLEILPALKFVAVGAPAVLSCTSPEDVAMRDRPYARPNRSKTGCSPTLLLKDLKAGPLSRKEAPLWTVSSCTMFRHQSSLNSRCRLAIRTSKARRQKGTVRLCGTMSTRNKDELEQEFFELTCYMISSARNLIPETKLYGPFRLVDAVSSLIDVLQKLDLKSPRLEAIQNQIEEGKYTVMELSHSFPSFFAKLASSGCTTLPVSIICCPSIQTDDLRHIPSACDTAVMFFALNIGP
jgi:hypothetical protein